MHLFQLQERMIEKMRIYHGVVKELWPFRKGFEADQDFKLKSTLKKCKIDCLFLWLMILLGNELTAHIVSLEALQSSPSSFSSSPSFSNSSYFVSPTSTSPFIKSTTPFPIFSSLSIPSDLSSQFNYSVFNLARQLTPKNNLNVKAFPNITRPPFIKKINLFSEKSTLLHQNELHDFTFSFYNTTSSSQKSLTDKFAYQRKNDQKSVNQPSQKPNLFFFKTLLFLFLFGKETTTLSDRNGNMIENMIFNHKNTSLSKFKLIQNISIIESNTITQKVKLNYFLNLDKNKRILQNSALHFKIKQKLDNKQKRVQRCDMKAAQQQFPNPRQSTSQRIKATKCNILTIYRLKTADCSGRKLENIPTNLGEDLKVLNISKNEITFLKSNDLEIYKHIQDVILSNNRIEFIPGSTFCHLKLLHTLDLENNRLKKIFAGVVSNCSSLRVLSLKFNPLKLIDERAFEGLYNLEVLNLQNCYLEIFDLKLLKDLIKLQELNILGNRLTFLDGSRITFIPASLSILRFSGNQWRCDCRLTWMRTFLQDSSINWDFPRNPPLCSSPEILYGLPWSQLQSQQFACPALILTNLSSQSILQAREGDLVEIKCIFSGDPHPRLTWLASKDGVNFHPYTTNSTNHHPTLLNQFQHENLMPALEKNSINVGNKNNDRVAGNYNNYITRITERNTKREYIKTFNKHKSNKQLSSMNGNFQFSKPVRIDSIFVNLTEKEKIRDFKCVAENNAGRSEVTFKIMTTKHANGQLLIRANPEIVFGFALGCIFVLVMMIIFCRTLRVKCKNCSKNRTVVRNEDQNGFVFKNALDDTTEIEEERRREKNRNKQSQHKMSIISSQASTHGRSLNFKLAKSNIRNASKDLEQENYFVFTSLTRPSNNLHHKSITSTSAFSSYFISPSPFSNTTIPNKYAKVANKTNIGSMNTNNNAINTENIIKLGTNGNTHNLHQYYSTFPNKLFQTASNITPNLQNITPPPSSFPRISQSKSFYTLDKPKNPPFSGVENTNTIQKPFSKSFQPVSLSMFQTLPATFNIKAIVQHPTHTSRHQADECIGSTCMNHMHSVGGGGGGGRGGGGGGPSGAGGMSGVGEIGEMGRVSGIRKIGQIDEIRKTNADYVNNEKELGSSFHFNQNQFDSILQHPPPLKNSISFNKSSDNIMSLNNINNNGTNINNENKNYKNSDNTNEIDHFTIVNKKGGCGEDMPQGSTTCVALNRRRSFEMAMHQDSNKKKCNNTQTNKQSQQNTENDTNNKVNKKLKSCIRYESNKKSHNKNMEADKTSNRDCNVSGLDGESNSTGLIIYKNNQPYQDSHNSADSCDV